MTQTANRFAHHLKLHSNILEIGIPYHNYFCVKWSATSWLQSATEINFKLNVAIPFTGRSTHINRFKTRLKQSLTRFLRYRFLESYKSSCVNEISVFFDVLGDAYFLQNSD